jgi:hypothetical protein
MAAMKSVGMTSKPTPGRLRFRGHSLLRDGVAPKGRRRSRQYIEIVAPALEAEERRDVGRSELKAATLNLMEKRSKFEISTVTSRTSCSS